MSLNYYNDEISLSSLKNDARNYTKSTFQSDLMAGLTVSMLALPQAMAYSLVAGLPLSCGLFSAIFGSIVSAIFGSSRHLVLGPSNAIAILVQSGTSEILFNHYRDVVGVDREWMALQIVIQLCLLVGFIQILVAFFKVGRLAQFVSHSVVAGYITGATIALVINQLFIFVGMPQFMGVSSLYEKGVYLLTHINSVHLPTVFVGLSGLTLMILLSRLNKWVPVGAIMLIIVSIGVHMLGLSSYNTHGLLDLTAFGEASKVTLVGDVGDVYQTIKNFELPYFNPAIMNSLLPVAFAIALLSILETTTVAKSTAANSGQLLSVNQEIFGLGLANMFASIIGAMPCSASPSRSALMYSKGGKTRFAAIYSGIFVAAMTMLFSFLISRIPLAALSALLLCNVVNIVNKRQFLLCFKATRSDALVLLLTMTSCIFLSLDVAFYIGVFMSITLYLKKAAVPQLVECSFDADGHIGTVPASGKAKHQQIRMINVRGELFFGAADLFQSALKSITEDDSDTKVIILRLKNARDIDATACLAIQQLYEYLKGSGRHLIACSLTHQSWEVLCDSGIIELMGKENVFILDERHSYLSEQRAMARANEWLATHHAAEQLIPESDPKLVTVPSQEPVLIKS